MWRLFSRSTAYQIPRSILARAGRGGRSDWPEVGIFAQRGKNRPNRIGVTVCRLLSVKGLTIRVEGLDAIDGTPVLDIKPYIAGFRAQGSSTGASLGRGANDQLLGQGSLAVQLR